MNSKVNISVFINPIVLAGSADYLIELKNHLLKLTLVLTGQLTLMTELQGVPKNVNNLMTYISSFRGQK